jgi:integrase
VDRSDTEIVIPIIEPLQKIMDEIAAKPEKGALVFPQIYAGETDEKKQRARISQENQNIRKRLGRLVKSMGWEVTPSGTWCRHSFATNLSHAGGVPKEYIQEAMGHSVMSGTVTDRYIQSYPIAQQMVFNSRLLNLNDDADIMEELKGLTPEQIKALIAMVKNV